MCRGGGSVGGVEVARFGGEYELVAGLYGVSSGKLRERDERRGGSTLRWVATRGGEASAAVEGWLRPDDRMFVSFVGDRRSYAELADAAAVELERPLYTFVDAADDELMAVLQSGGFEVEITEERFSLRFDQVLAGLRRAWVPSGFSIRSADTVDEDRLFALDNVLRNDVPGIDGWKGDRAWFRDELAESPPFDPSAYLVAVDDDSGAYVGLVRIWRNPSGPRFGLVGVRREYRHTPIAAALLREALAAASQWGYGSFTAETSPANPAIYRRMARVDAESLGRFYQMVRR